jgi:hypothetical protein
MMKGKEDERKQTRYIPVGEWRVGDDGTIDLVVMRDVGSHGEWWCK